jgi:putative flippase GtrA
LASIPDRLETAEATAPWDLRSAWPGCWRLKSLLERKAGALAYPVQFALVGLSGMVLDLLAFALLGLWLPLAVARALAIWLAMTWNYALNRRVTFAAYRQDFRWRDYGLCCGSCLAGALVSWTICMALCAADGWFARHPLVAALLGVAAGFVLNYSLSRRFVFRPETAGLGAAPVGRATAARHPAASRLPGTTRRGWTAW